MPPSLFLQNVIAVVWDFDKTLIPGYMQEPMFEQFGVDADVFWAEVNGLPAFYRERGLELVSPDSIYLNHMLTYVREGVFRGLSNEMLREFGSRLTFFPGVPSIFQRLRERLAAHEGARQHEITLEYYIVSTGLRQTILGSSVTPLVDGVWGCEFVDSAPPPGYLETPTSVGPRGEIRQVGYVIDNTTKTRAIFEINKGCNKFANIDVNSFISPENRRVPFQNMIYVADGPSDVPVFSVVKGQGGLTYAVFPRGNERALAQVDQLLQEGRVHAFGEADYEAGSQTAIWLWQAVARVADRITADRNRVMDASVGRAPRHLV